jgi:aminoglycoside phosphotransferase (APT) family kinase protein
VGHRWTHLEISGCSNRSRPIVRVKGRRKRRPTGNIVWDGTEPVGLLDFEYARPGDPLNDVAYACEYFVPFRDDAECLRWLRYPEPPDRRRRLLIFADSYGLSSADGLVASASSLVSAFP